MTDTSAGPIRLFVLGDARIETPMGVIEPTAELVFAAALYLILERREPVSRRKLEKILWPDVDEAVASHRLRQTLLKLRRLGFPVKGNAMRLSLDDATVCVDYEQLASSPQSPPRDHGSLAVFPDYEPDISREFSRWVETKRDTITGVITPAMLAIISQRRSRGDWAGVEYSASGLLRADPYNEEATLALAEAHAMRGSKLESVRILDRYLGAVGKASSDLRVPATALRKRIVDRAPPPSSSTATVPMLERGGMMQQLGTLLRSARDSRGSACVIRGDAGIGKTRLLTEFAAFAAIQGVASQRVQSRPSDAMRPLSLFIDLVPMLRALRGSIGCSAETMAYLDRLTKRRAFGDVSGTDHGDPQFRYSRVERALFDLFDAIAEETTVLVQVEDIQFLDEASQSVLIHLVEWCSSRRVLFALTTREKPGWLFKQASGVMDIELRPLSDEGAATMIRSVLQSSGREMEEDYEEWCIRVADGNPFFLQELAQQWAETGTEHTAPASINAVLEERISRLEPDALQLLQVCAALENHSTFDRIEAVLKQDPHLLLRSFNALAHSGMLQGGPLHEATQPYLLQPRHDLISAAALQRLTRPAQVFLHRRVAMVLQDEISIDDSSALLWDCAKHWQMAGDSSRALQLGRSCGFHLLELGLPVAAAEAFEKALSFCSHPSETLDILRAQAQSYGQSTSWSALLRVEGLARSLASQLGMDKDSYHDDLELLALRAEWKTDHDEVALNRLVLCLESEQATPDHRVKAGTMALMLQDVTCRHGDMPRTFSQIENLSRDQEVSKVGRLEAALVYHTLCGQLTEAITAAENLLAIKRGKEDQGEVFRHLQNASVAYRTTGRFEESVSCLLEAVEIAKAHRLPKSLARVLSLLAHLALERGRVEEATHWYNEITRLDLASDDVYVTLDTMSIRVRLAIALPDARLTAPQLIPLVRQNAFPRMGQPRTYSLALAAAVRLASNESLSSTELSDLEHAHLSSRRCIAQAFGAYVLYVALRRAGHLARADELLHDYHSAYRRETWHASQLFQQLRAQLGDSF